MADDDLSQQFLFGDLLGEHSEPIAPSRSFTCDGCGKTFPSVWRKKEKCRDCLRKAREATNREKLNVRMREYRVLNGERLRAQAIARTRKRAELKVPAPEIPCPNCGTMFSPRDPRQECCSRPCGVAIYNKSDIRLAQQHKKYLRNRDEIRAKTTERYHNDPEYREKLISTTRAKRAENPEHARAINAKSRAKPEHRIKAAHLSRMWHSENREHANQERSVRIQRSRNETPWYVLIKAAEARAKKKGLPFSLTSEWGRSRWTGSCELTGIQFTVGLRGVGAKMFSPSIDRIDPKVGYVPTNCRFILWCVNAFKYSGTDDQMIMVARALVERSGIMLEPNPTHYAE